MNKLQPLLLQRGDALKSQGLSESTLQIHQSVLSQFQRWCAQASLRAWKDVTLRDLEAYQLHLASNPQRLLSPRTQQAHLLILQHFFQWACAQGHLLHDPSALLILPRLPQRLPKTLLSAEDFEILLRQPDCSTPLGLRDRALLELLYATALRAQEGCHLLPSDLDRSAGLLWVRQGKGKKDRVVPLTPRALRWIQRYEEQGRSRLLSGAKGQPDTLFLTRYGQPLPSPQACYRVHHYLSLPPLHKTGSCHLIRHSVATLMLQNGCDIRSLQEFLGHRHLKTTQIYTQVALPGLLQAYQKTHPSLRAEPEENSGIFRNPKTNEEHGGKAE